MSPPPSAPPLARAMRPRDPGEQRGQTALELLFDLAFSAASGFAAVQFAQALLSDRGPAPGAVPAVAGFTMVFFAIWWAWVSFSRFSSAYDTDDGLTWGVTTLQIVGACVLAAGVPRAFTEGDFAVITAGYAVMRVPLAAQWCRAAAGDPERRATCLRFAAALVLLQVGWVGRLALPEAWLMPSFLLLAAGEGLAPLWAARPGQPPVNPAHFAGRHLRFTLTVAAQTVAATIWSVQVSLDSTGRRGTLLAGSVLAVVIVVCLIWLYVGMPHADLVARRHTLLWTYGHGPILGALCAVGSGVRFLTARTDAPDGTDGAAVPLAVAVAVALLALWGVCVLPGSGAGGPAGAAFPAAAVVVVAVSVLPVHPLVATGAVAAVLLALCGVRTMARTVPSATAAR